MSTVIRLENISKQYRLGTVGTGSFAHDLNRAWHRLRGKEDPYLKIGAENDRTAKGGSKLVWALRDVNFDVKHGDVLGIIGRNGAGKSTLLKILSRTTAPTTGKFKIKGRVASLLEVGTGFHPELSGRENVFLNGAILGMTKREIRSKFDEIVDFAGVERYIDTPVKRYSSGMYVRLAFAVAAHLEPEILIVDEVLAVGDAEFQKRALSKMKDVSNKQGRTVLFVSHNMAALKSICSNGIILNNGHVLTAGDVNSVVDRYVTSMKADEKLENNQIFQGDNCRIERVTIQRSQTGLIRNSEELKITTIFLNERSEPCSIIFSLKRNDNLIFAAASFYKQEAIETGLYEVTVLIPKHLLNPGYHTLDIMIVDESGNYKSYLFAESVLSFSIEDDLVRRGGKYLKGWDGAISPLLPIEWSKLVP